MLNATTDTTFSFAPADIAFAAFIPAAPPRARIVMPSRYDRPRHRRGAENVEPPPVDLDAYALETRWPAWAAKARSTRNITPSAQTLVLVLSQWMRPGQPFIASYDTIMEKTGLPRSTLSCAITSLENAGLLVRITRWKYEDWPEGGPGARRRVQDTNAYLPTLLAPDDVYEQRFPRSEASFATGAVSTLSSIPSVLPVPPLESEIALTKARNTIGWEAQPPVRTPAEQIAAVLGRASTA